MVRFSSGGYLTIGAAAGQCSRPPIFTGIYIQDHSSKTKLRVPFADIWNVEGSYGYHNPEGKGDEGWSYPGHCLILSR